MSPQRKTGAIASLTAEWPLPASATLGSLVRAKGILQEVRARLPAAQKKALDIRATTLVLGMPEGAEKDFRSASAIISSTLGTIESRPVIPREIEDILTISATERHRWLKDGRLQSAGTRTVKLYGRAKKITFHVFDPRRVEEVLDRDLVDAWREEDALTAAENRRRAAWKAKLARSQKNAPQPAPDSASTPEDAPRPKLKGWEDFERDGPLR